MLVKNKDEEKLHLLVADEDGIGKDEPIAEGHVAIQHLMQGAGEGEVTFKGKSAGKVSWAAANWQPVDLEEIEARIQKKIAESAPATNQNKKKNKKNKK